MAFRSRPLSGRSLSEPVRGFDLDEELARLREETEWREGRRNAITLHKGGGLSVVLLAMRAGDRLEEHSAPGPISLVVREGRIRFTAEGEPAVEAGSETMLACDTGRGTPRCGGPERCCVLNQRGERRVSLEEQEPVATPIQTDLEALVTAAAGREGVVWALDASEDLNANLVRFGAGRGVGEHVNNKVDVVFVGVSGTGLVEVDDRAHVLEAGKLVFVPKGAKRSTRGASEHFAYLTLHGRRGPLRIEAKPEPKPTRKS